MGPFSSLKGWKQCNYLRCHHAFIYVRETLCGCGCCFHLDLCGPQGGETERGGQRKGERGRKRERENGKRHFHSFKGKSKMSHTGATAVYKVFINVTLNENNQRQLSVSWKATSLQQRYFPLTHTQEAGTKWGWSTVLITWGDFHLNNQYNYASWCWDFNWSSVLSCWVEFSFTSVHFQINSCEVNFQ